MTDPVNIIDDLTHFGQAGDHKKLYSKTKHFYKTDEQISNSTFFDYSLDSNTKIFNPPSRKYHMSCLVDNFLYIYGGLDKDNNYLNDFYKLDVISNRWTLLSVNGTNPGLRARTDMVSRNGNIYMVGGATPSGGDNKVFKYVISTNTWSEITFSNSIFTTSTDHSTVVYQQWLYITGGKNFGATFSRDSVYYFDLDLITPTWMQTGKMRSRMFNHKAVVIGNEIFTFFGFDNTGTAIYDRVCVNTINASGGISGGYTRLPDSTIKPLSMGEYSLSVIGTDVYIYGGRRNFTSSIYDGQLAIYNTVTRNNLSWTIVNNYLVDDSVPPQTILGRAATTMNLYVNPQGIEKLFLFGGFNNSIAYSDVRDIIENDIKETIIGDTIFLGVPIFVLNGVRYKTETIEGYTVVTMEKILPVIPTKFYMFRIYTPP